MAFAAFSVSSTRFRRAWLAAGTAALALVIALGAGWLAAPPPEPAPEEAEPKQAGLPQAQAPALRPPAKGPRVRLRHAVGGAQVRAWRLGRPLATTADWSATTDSQGGFALDPSAGNSWHLLAASGGMESSAAAEHLSMRGTLRGLISAADLARGAALSPLTDFAWFFARQRLGAALLRDGRTEALTRVLDDFSQAVAGSNYSDLVRWQADRARPLIDKLGLMAGLAPSVYGGGGLGARHAFYGHLWRAWEAQKEGRGRVLRRDGALIAEAPAEKGSRLLGVYAEDGMHLLFSVAAQPGAGILQIGRDGDDWLLRLAAAELIRSHRGSAAAQEQGSRVTEWRWRRPPRGQPAAEPPGFFDLQCVVFDPAWDQCALVEAEDFYVVAVPPSVVAGTEGEGLSQLLQPLLPHLGRASEVIEEATDLWPRIAAAMAAQAVPEPQLQIAGFRPQARALHYGDAYVLVALLPRGAGAAAGGERRLEIEMLPPKAGEPPLAWRWADRAWQLGYTAPEGAAVIAVAKELLLAEGGPENREVRWRLYQHGYSEIRLAAVLTHFREAPEAASPPEAVAASREVSLSWPAVPRAHSYQLHWSRGHGEGQGVFRVAGPGYRHGGLENGVEYSYWLNAVNALGLSEVSPEVAATPLAEDDPRRQADRWHGNFLATKKTYDEKVNGEQKCRQLYGDAVRLADWQDLASFYGGSDSPSFDQFLSRLFPRRKKSYRLSYGGEQTYRMRKDRPRRFFASRFDHDKPDSFHAHADLSDHLLTLGSWYGRWAFLCLAPEAAP